MEVSTDGGKKWNKAEFRERRSGWRIPGSATTWKWDGNECELMSRCTDELGQVQPTRAQIAKYWNEPFDQTFSVPGLDNTRSAVEDRERRERAQWASRRLLPIAFCVADGRPALAQSATYGVGRTPTAEEIRALDISIGPTGEELPPGHGTAKEGAQLYRAKGCAGCHGAAGIGGTAPNLKSKDPTNPDVWARGRILPLRAPFATTVWDYINRGMPLNREGTLTADEVYALTAYLLFINDVIPEDEVLDAAESAEGQDADWRQLRRCLSGSPRRQGLRATPTEWRVPIRTIWRRVVPQIRICSRPKARVGGGASATIDPTRSLRSPPPPFRGRPGCPTVASRRFHFRPATAATLAYRPTEGARDEEAISTDTVRRRPDHGGARHRRLRPAAGGEARHAELPDLLRSEGAGGVRARCRDDPFLLVHGRAPGVRGCPPAGSRLRHRLLGHRDGFARQHAGRAAVARECQRGLGCAGEGARDWREDGARARLDRRDPRLLPRS